MTARRFALLGVSCAALLLAAGCKSDIGVEVTDSQLLGAATDHPGYFVAQVVNCKDDETKLESSSVLEAKQKVSYIFPRASYQGCRSEDFESFVHFTLPVRVGGDLKTCGADEVCVGVVGGKKVTFTAGAGVRSRFDQVSRSSISLLDTEDLKINIHYTNDTGKARSIYFPSLFVVMDGSRLPYHDFSGSLKAGAQVDLELSNVVTAQVLSGKDATAFVLRQ